MGDELTSEAIIASTFHHSVLLPFFRLDERAGENILVDRDYNDICLMAADICVACYHLKEFVAARDTHFARRIAAFRLWRLLGNVANTRKHYNLDNKRSEVRLSASLAFEVNAIGWYGFLETKVLGTRANGEQFDVVDLIGEFIEYFRSLTNGNNGQAFQKNARQPQAFREAAFLRFTAATTAVRNYHASLSRRNRAGGLEAAVGFPLKLKVELDLKNTERVGRYDLNFDMPLIKSFLDSVDEHVAQHPPS